MRHASDLLLQRSKKDTATKTDHFNWRMLPSRIFNELCLIEVQTLVEVPLYPNGTFRLCLLTEMPMLDRLSRGNPEKSHNLLLSSQSPSQTDV